MILEEIEIEMSAIVNGGVLSNSDVPEMEYLLVIDTAQVGEVAVQEETDQLVDRSCCHSSRDHTEETFEHLTEGLD